MCTDWDYVQVRDFEYLNNLWTEKENILDDIPDMSIELGKKLINELNVPFDPYPLNVGQSQFFKTVYKNPERVFSNIIDKE